MDNIKINILALFRLLVFIISSLRDVVAMKFIFFLCDITMWARDNKILFFVFFVSFGLVVVHLVSPG